MPAESWQGRKKMKKFLTPDNCPGFTGRVVKLGKRFATVLIENKKFHVNRVYLDWIYKDMPTGERQLYLPLGSYINTFRSAWSYASKGTHFLYRIEISFFPVKEEEEDISIK
jgi:hypothetical protein